MTPQHIAVVDDEADITQLLAHYLSGHGFRTTQLSSGHALMELMPRDPPELVLLDLGLPGEDGFAIARQLREHWRCGLVIITGRGDAVDKVVGLEIGADDYVTKPFDLRELLARIDAALRRRRLQARETSQVAFGTVTIDFQARTVTLKGQDIPMTPREFDLLALLVRNPRKAYSREQILREVWGFDYEGTTRTVDNFVVSLRQKLEDDPQNPRYLVTVRTVGYRFDP